MSVVREMRCPHCSAPLHYAPGEALFTCRYCGYTGYIDLSVQFKLAHSVLPPRLSAEEVDGIVKKWMETGYAKPRDLAKKAEVKERRHLLVPFWLVPVKATTNYRGLLVRLGPSVEKSGKVEGAYDWFVLARSGVKVPARIFDLPVSERVPFNLGNLPAGVEALNAELDAEGAKEKAKREIELFHVERAKESVDRFIELKTEYEFGEPIYVHVPLWFVRYEYRKAPYEVIVDGHSGKILFGELPPSEIGIF
ncbi:MAG: hypothetical protein JTT11_03125 [Candidatus Brockarchaeota archaeon]|nr:hypothetical protein [Candidatus Brockarchaeota archaeon]